MFHFYFVYIFTFHLYHYAVLVHWFRSIEHIDVKSIIMFFNHLLCVSLHSALRQIERTIVTQIELMIFDEHFFHTSADVSNWNPMPNDSNDNKNVNSTSLTYKTGSFFAYGLSGMFKGAAIILFTFIAFDATMIMSQCPNLFGNGTSKIPKQQQQQPRFANDGYENIENFIRTIPNAILSINAGLFLCLLGMALPLITIQPYYLLVSAL